VSWETAVWAPLYTTYWGLLSQPDKQKPAKARNRLLAKKGNKQKPKEKTG
jgi:hypothetical protein